MDEENEGWRGHPRPQAQASECWSVALNPRVGLQKLHTKPLARPPAAGEGRQCCVAGAGPLPRCPSGAAFLLFTDGRVAWEKHLIRGPRGGSLERRPLPWAAGGPVCDGIRPGSLGPWTASLAPLQRQWTVFTEIF